MEDGFQKQRRRVRMSDVAEQAGVSRTTASFVLNDRAAGIAEATRQRVLLVAKQLGYEPHASARALATGRTQRIGIALTAPEYFLTPDLYFARILSGIIAGNLHRDYNLLFHTVHYPDWRALRSDILSGTTDGVLLVGRPEGDELTRSLLDAGFPTVCISYHMDHPACCSVDCDNAAGGRMAVQHLLSLGHRSIVVYYSGHGTSWGRERLEGARSAIEQAGLPGARLDVYDWAEPAGPPETDASLNAVVAAVCSSNSPPTALFCGDEGHAHWLVERLQQKGVRIPEDLSMVTFNSTDLSARSDPPLTSISQPMTEIGSAAVEALADLVENGTSTPLIHRFPVQLDVRESTAPPAR